MASREARANPRAGWGLWRALLSLSVLAALAFVLGGLAGLVWKQPGLLFAHLTGQTREVAWGVPAPQDEEVQHDSKTAAAEAPPAPVPVARPPAPRDAAPPRVSPPPPAVAAAPPPAAAGSAARIAIQVGAFGERSSAERLRGALQQEGYPAYVAPAATSGSPRWRVRVGPYPSREDADRVAARLKTARALPTWVLDEDAP